MANTKQRLNVHSVRNHTFVQFFSIFIFYFNRKLIYLCRVMCHFIARNLCIQITTTPILAVPTSDYYLANKMFAFEKLQACGSVMLLIFTLSFCFAKHILCVSSQNFQLLNYPHTDDTRTPTYKLTQSSATYN